MWNFIPSWVTGANLAVFGSSLDSIGPYIAGNTAAVALWSPGTWPVASALGGAQAQGWVNQLVFAGSFGASSFDYLGGLSNIVAWAQSPLFQ
jgi:hypothetical protein